MRILKVIGAAVASAALVVSGAVVGATSAHSAPVSVTNATLAWQINEEVGGGAYFGGCNFLSAGKAGDTGKSRVWTKEDNFYASRSGDVLIQKRSASGGWERPTWETKCQDANGQAVKTTAGSSTYNRAVFRKGTGSFDTANGTATISWSGSITVAFYGGFIYWSASDPKLTVNADGTGTLTATASGYGASMQDPTKWVALTPRTITLANLKDVSVTSTGFVSTPEYLGVEIDSTGGQSSQVTSGDNWGSFPQDFIDFQIETGQSSYWYSSGGAADPKKVTTTDGFVVTFDDKANYAESTTLTAEPSTRAYGTASDITVEATSPLETPVGTVSVTSGSKTLASGSLSDGSARLRISGTALPVGNNKLTVKYAGNDYFNAASTTVTVTVTKAAAKISQAKLAKKKIKAKKKSSVNVTVTSSATPTGTVKVTWKGTKGKAKGKTITRTAKLKASGKAVVKSTKLKKKGTYKVTVAYQGSATHSKATKAAGKLKVK